MARLMQRVDLSEESRRDSPRPGPVGLAMRVLLGAFTIYWFAALLTKWSVFLESDPIESGRFYTLASIWLLPYVFNLTFRRSWGPWPSLVLVGVGGLLGFVGYLAGSEFWNPVLAGWVYAADLFVMGALAVSFPVAIATRSPGCELGAIPWLIAKRRGETYLQPRPGCAIGLDYVDRWEAKHRAQTRTRPRRPAWGRRQKVGS